MLPQNMCDISDGSGSTSMNMNKVLGKLAKLDVKQFLSLIIKEKAHK
jgi:hypothetical protein